MTRFARAHGSKGSNERQPEDSTPWAVLRNQMLESQERQCSRPEDLDGTAFNDEDDDAGEMDLKIQDITSSLKKKKVYPKSKTYETQYVTDCETPPAVASNSQDGVSEPFGEKKGKTKKKKDKGGRVSESPSGTNSPEKFYQDSVSETFDEKKRKSKKKKVMADSESESPSESNTSEMFYEKHDKNNKMQEAIDVDEDCEDIGVEIVTGKEQLTFDRQIRKKKRKLQDISERELSVEVQQSKKKKKKKITNKSDSDNKYLETDEHLHVSLSENGDECDNTADQISSKQETRKLKWKKEAHDWSQEQQLQRKKGPIVFFIDKHKEKMKERKRNNVPFSSVLPDGRELTLKKFDGFDVLKDDAQRLQTLRNKLRSSGIPGGKVREVMQLERRRAEKALQREKKKVCFHCRQPGHVMADCTEFSIGRDGDGICFKCGSTEHRSYECRVSRGENFQFAKCFICGGEGHIARQCQDNPRGLYPQGGGCYVCGDVTHLKKDCPDLAQTRSEEKITVERFHGSTNVEALDDNRSHSNKRMGGMQKNKIVKF